MPTPVNKGKKWRLQLEASKVKGKDEKSKFNHWPPKRSKRLGQKQQADPNYDAYEKARKVQAYLRRVPEEKGFMITGVWRFDSDPTGSAAPRCDYVKEEKQNIRIGRKSRSAENEFGENETPEEERGRSEADLWEGEKEDERISYRDFYFYFYSFNFLSCLSSTRHLSSSHRQHSLTESRCLNVLPPDPYFFSPHAGKNSGAHSALRIRDIEYW